MADRGMRHIRDYTAADMTPEHLKSCIILPYVQIRNVWDLLGICVNVMKPYQR